MANVDTYNNDQYKNNFNNLTVNNKYWNGVTERGTKVVTSQSNVSQDTFIKILCAQLQHQDPTQQQDSAAAVSQLAQFAQLEQLQSVNANMKKDSYYSLLGKGVVVADTDISGNNYHGYVQGIKMNNDGSATVNVLVSENGQNVEKSFSASNILQVIEPNNPTTQPLTSLDINMAFLMCSTFTGKDVTVEETDSAGKKTTYEGKVTSAVFENGVPMVNVKVVGEDGNEEIKKFNYTSIVKVSN